MRDLRPREVSETTPLLVRGGATLYLGGQVATSDLGTIDGADVWAGPLMDGSVGVVLLNRNETMTQTVTAQWPDIGLPADTEATVRDLWLHAKLGDYSQSFMSLPAARSRSIANWSFCASWASACANAKTPCSLSSSSRT